MNTFRTLHLILVLAIQVSGFLMSSNSESLGLYEYSGKASDIKRETSSKSALSSKDYTLKKEEIGCVNSPISRKEVPLKCLTQPTLIKKKRENLPANAVPGENKQPPRKVSVGVYIRSIGTGDAELF